MENIQSVISLEERHSTYNFYTVEIEVISSEQCQNNNDNQVGEEDNHNSFVDSVFSVSKCDEMDLISVTSFEQLESETNGQHNDHTYCQEDSTEGEHTVQDIVDSKSRVVLKNAKNEKTKHIASEIQTLPFFNIPSLNQSKNAAKKVKPPQKKNFLCSKCSFMTTTLSGILEHEGSHDIEYKYQCPICGVFLKNERSLKNHITNHVVGKCYQCTYCSARFGSRTRLVGHIRYIHTGETPYTCEICKKSFHVKSGLQRHMSIHSVLSKHHCPICNKGFTQTSNLQGHIRTHTNEKPFVCDICGKGFNFNHARKSHRLLCEKKKS